DHVIVSIPAPLRNRVFAWLVALLGFVGVPVGVVYAVNQLSTAVWVEVLAGVSLFVGVIAGMAGLTSGVAGWRSRRMSKVVVNDAGQVQRRAQPVYRRSNRVMAPRLVVCRVVTPLWQAMVHAFATRSAAVVMDLSEPTESVLWEVELLRRSPQLPHVF